MSTWQVRVHTPGPWNYFCGEVVDPRGYGVFDREARRFGAAEIDRNLRLAAAAPEMLEALRALLTMPVLAALPAIGSGPVDAARTLLARLEGAK